MTNISNGADIYSYADSIKRSLAKGKLTQQTSPFRGITTMKNTTGRDNKMYYVSDGFNLKAELENQFTSMYNLTRTPTSSSQLNKASVPSLMPNIRS